MSAQVTSREVTINGQRYAESIVVGAVNAANIDEMALGYTRWGGGESWLIDAALATRYEPDALRRAPVVFGSLTRTHGLKRIVAVIKSPIVRMGAMTVRMAMRVAGTPVLVEPVETRAEAIALIGKKLDPWV